MNPQMDPLDNPLTTSPIKTRCGFPSHHTRIDRLGQLRTRMANFVTGQF
jgi:hypothetical protein